jgi:L-threonine kinase
MASSSADLVATARAVGGVLGADTSPSAVEDLLRPIEPTDGVMHPGAVAFDHRDVRLRDMLGALPPMAIVAVDEGGSIDTVAFNQRPKHYTDAHRAEYATLLDSLTEAVHTGDVAEIGRVATRSAVLNQRLVPKRNLDELTGIADRVGALGVVCAHSGTMIGLLLDASDPAHRRRLVAARAECAALAGASTVIRTLTFHDTEHIHAS